MFRSRSPVSYAVIRENLTRHRRFRRLRTSGRAFSLLRSTSTIGEAMLARSSMFIALALVLAACRPSGVLHERHSGREAGGVG